MSRHQRRTRQSQDAERARFRTLADVHGQSWMLDARSSKPLVGHPWRWSTDGSFPSRPRRSASCHRRDWRDEAGERPVAERMVGHGPGRRASGGAGWGLTRDRRAPRRRRVAAGLRDEQPGPAEVASAGRSAAGRHRRTVAVRVLHRTIRHIDLNSGLLETMTEVGVGAMPGAVANR